MNTHYWLSCILLLVTMNFGQPYSFAMDSKDCLDFSKFKEGKHKTPILMGVYEVHPADGHVTELEVKKNDLGESGTLTGLSTEIPLAIFSKDHYPFHVIQYMNAKELPVQAIQIGFGGDDGRDDIEYVHLGIFPDVPGKWNLMRRYAALHHPDGIVIIGFDHSVKGKTSYGFIEKVCPLGGPRKAKRPDHSHLKKYLR